MNELLSFANYAKELGSTVLIVAAATWILVKYIPAQMRQQGETIEAIRHNSSVIHDCTEALKLVSGNDDNLEKTLSRMEDRMGSIELDIHDLKTNKERRDHA